MRKERGSVRVRKVKDFKEAALKKEISERESERSLKKMPAD